VSKKSPENIRLILQSKKEKLYSDYRISRLGIFGSVVRGEANNHSDIDILIEYIELPDLLKFIELERKLSRIIGKKVDLVEKNSIRPELLTQILSEVDYI
jgi:uncharacterized protein